MKYSDERRAAILKKRLPPHNRTLAVLIGSLIAANLNLFKGLPPK